MAKPVIMTVDDDPQVLAAIDHDLRTHFHSDFRIVRAASGSEGLEAARQLKTRGVPVALFLVDERMPLMSGTAMLQEAVKIHPEARRVLLTAYADTDAAIRGINDVGLDHYLLKPWDPPEERLYPVLDDLLFDWRNSAALPFDGIRVAGSLWSPESYATKDFLSRNHVPYQWIDVDQDPSVRELIGDTKELPAVLFPDGVVLRSPTNRVLAEKVGIHTQASEPFYDLVIIGAGPAGLAAAVYGASEGLRTLLVEQEAPGGQAGTSSRIENYLGFHSGISGADLARRAHAQAVRFGVEILGAQQAASIRLDAPYRVVKLTDGSEVSCKALVVATGVAVRQLDVPGLEALAGTAVFYGAALTEAARYGGQDICVVGGGNSAGQGALFFSRYARKVTVMIRANDLSASMSRYLVDRLEAAENIEILANVVTVELSGADHVLEKATLRDVRTGRTFDLPVRAMFIFIGAAPHTQIVADLVDRDDKGFILTGPDLARDAKGRLVSWRLDRAPYILETSVPGVFAVGDVRSGSGKRVASAVGEGSGCVAMVHRYLETV